MSIASLAKNHKDFVLNNLNFVLEKTDLNIPRSEKYVGKVRDTYALDDKLILVTTDRQSAFDRILASVPFKGQVLNQTSNWWFEQTKHIVKNHVLANPDPNVTVSKKIKIFPIEMVVRGYLTGSTGTSAWINYQKGVRDFCGNTLPENMKKNQKFNSPILTPTTKSNIHDELISPEDIVERNLMTKEEWDFVAEKTLEIFNFASKKAKTNGLILVDTKFEFGKDEDGNIYLADEILTPDSSRYWIQDSYKTRFENNEEPENIDKEFLRLWFKNNCDPYNDSELPKAPDDLIAELSARYIKLYETITGEKFTFPDTDQDINQRIQENIANQI